MHAYASTDPVFRALNALGQRETGGALGDRCVKCHAPMAHRLGATVDGSNLDELQPGLQGVTCAFCHLVDRVDGTHDNPLHLADDGVMRGGIEDPIPTPAHGSAYSPLHDASSVESASLCGSCHDVVLQSGLHLERTFLEWQQSRYAATGATCGSCHAPGFPGRAAALDGAPRRTVHSHAAPAVDLALVPFPRRDAQRLAVVSELENAIAAELCVQTATSGAVITMSLANRFAGHAIPSGAAQHRLLEVQVDGEVQWRLGKDMLDVDGAVTEVMWEAVDLRGEVLPPSTPDLVWRTKSLTTSSIAPSSVEMSVTMVPLRASLLEHVVASGDLDPDVAARVEAIPLSSLALTWSAGDDCVRSRL